MEEIRALETRDTYILGFFVKDRIDKKELSIEYCPSTDMLADFFTKPLQGQLFKKFRNAIMGHAPMSVLNHPPFKIK